MYRNFLSSWTLLCLNFIWISQELCLSCTVVNPSNDSRGVLDFFSQAGLLLGQKPPIEAHMSTPELIGHNGYQVEEHYVITKDGYNLTLFRIPRGKTTFNTTQELEGGGEPVILQHGLLSSSDDWLLLYPHSQDNLPYLLADAGYDVWLTNAKGNNYSMRHVSLSPDGLPFWDFSIDEMGLYDAPAFINYILEKSGKTELSYVSHSMGCTMFFIAMATNPELQSKIRKMVALAPGANIQDVISPIGNLLTAVPDPVLETLLNLCNSGQVFKPEVTHWLNRYGPFLCTGRIPSVMCSSLIFFAVGYDYNQTNIYTPSMITGHTPSQASGKTLVQFVQWARKAKNTYFDYGSLGNMKKYGSPYPPEYDLTLNHVPTFIMHGVNDWLIRYSSIAATAKQLGNVQRVQAVDHPCFEHLDFFYAVDAKTLVYDYCMDFLST